MTIRTSTHKKWPWNTWHIPQRNLVSKSISFVLCKRQVTIENVSYPRNNKQPWSTWPEIKEKIDFKIKKVCGLYRRLPLKVTMLTSSHNKWPWSTWYIPKRHLVSKSKSIVLYQEMSDSLIEYFIWSVTLKQNKYPNSMQMALTLQIWILLSQINLKHFILSVLMNIKSKRNFCKAVFEITITHSTRFSEKHFGFACLPLKNKVAKK